MEANRHLAATLALVLCLALLGAGHAAAAVGGPAGQDAAPLATASTGPMTDFGVVVELCFGGAQIVDDLRRVTELDICQVQDRYDEIGRQHRRDREAGQRVLEFLVSRLTSFSLQDLPWADLLARVEQRDANGHSYRVFASRIGRDSAQRLRWIAPLLLVDRFVDPHLVRRVEEGVALGDAVGMALGANGYAYVDRTTTPVGGWSHAVARRMVVARTEGALRGVGFELHADEPSGQYMTLSRVFTGNRVFVSGGVPERLREFLEVVDLTVVPREDYLRGDVFPVVPLLPYQYEAVGDLVVEHGWDPSAGGVAEVRPFAGMIVALARQATEVVVQACTERLDTADQAWVYVTRAENLPTAMKNDDELWRDVIFAEAMGEVDAQRECLSVGGIEAKFRAAFDAAYLDRRAAALRRLEEAYGAAWRRAFWVGARLVGCVRLSQDDCDVPRERASYEEQYDRMMERVREIAWQRERAAQELQTQREAAASALELAETKAAAMIEKERIAAQATLQRVEADLEKARLEAEASVRRAEEAHRQAIEVATIEGRSAVELARLNNEHELKKISTEADAKVRVAELEVQAKIAVAESETDSARLRAETDEQIARIRKDQATEVALLRQSPN